MNAAEKIKWWFKLLWYNNIQRHIGNWQWRKQLDREPEIEEQWYAEGHTISLRTFVGGKLNMTDIVYGVKLADEIESRK